jgi:hypothetical protein
MKLPRVTIKIKRGFKMLGVALVFGLLIALQINHRPPEWLLRLHPTDTEQQLRSLAAKIARRHRIDEDLFIAMIEVESNFSTEAKSSAGAIGLAQIMPANIGRVGLTRVSQLWIPYFNLRGGAIMLSQEKVKTGNYRDGLKNYLCYDKSKCDAAAEKYADMVMAKVGSRKL